MRWCWHQGLGAVTIGLFAIGCVPGSGWVERPKRDAQRAGDGPKLTLLDGAGRQQDIGDLPKVDSGSVSTPDQGVTPAPDSYRPPTPDTGPTGPQPPFGSLVGMTAANFIGLPDCSGKPYDLHGFFNKQPALVLLLNKPS